MITIHGSPVSPFVRKTLVCLIEKGVNYELNPISPFPAPESHLKISPLGKIPAMTDGDFALADSAAICGYIDRKHPEKPMFPTDVEDYGRALWFQIWADNELAKANQFCKVLHYSLGLNLFLGTKSTQWSWMLPVEF